MTSQGDVRGPLAHITDFAVSHGLDHYLVPSSDEHLNEYVPPWACRRAFLSNFDGSAGDLLVGLTGVRLFTDGRYHIQARRQLDGTGIELVPVGSPGAPSLQEFLAEFGGRLGVDPMLISATAAEALGHAVATAGGELVAVAENPVDQVWSDRPSPPTTKLWPVPTRWAGATTDEKLHRLRDALTGRGAGAFVTSKLDQVAWLLNLRSGDDVAFNPVFEAHVVVLGEEAHLFLHGGDVRLPHEFEGWEVHPYGEFHSFLRRLGGLGVWLDKDGTPWGVVEAISAAGGKTIAGPSPVEAAKARKNRAERDCMVRANLRASAAKTRALLWLKESLRSNVSVTETSFRDQLESEYAAVEDHWGQSFSTISAAGAHSAIAHYGECDDTPLCPGELFLVDSGVHNGGGTTDDTRTVAVGPVDPEARLVHTLVLKGHIQAAMARFPDGTPGVRIDELARGPLADRGLGYDHGTGHGVGAFLNVHEGPFALSEVERKPFAAHPLWSGMVTSIEPGYYREGWGGVRLENLYLVEDSEEIDGHLEFRCLTWIPFDTELVDRDLMSAEEIQWFDAYQDECRRQLAPFLNPSEARALSEWIDGPGEGA